LGRYGCQPRKLLFDFPISHLNAAKFKPVPWRIMRLICAGWCWQEIKIAKKIAAYGNDAEGFAPPLPKREMRTQGDFSAARMPLQYNFGVCFADRFAPAVIA
jgi:hypothetical protein